MLSDAERRRVIVAKVKTANPKGIKYLRTSMARKLRHGWVSQELHDFIISEIDKVTGKV